MNNVYELDQKKAGKDAVDRAILERTKLTKGHFADEEKHMASIGYADLKRHAMIHQDMLMKVSAHYEVFQAGDGTVPRAFFEFLVYWLKVHLLGIDRKYAPVRRRRDSVTAAAVSDSPAAAVAGRRRRPSDGVPAPADPSAIASPGRRHRW